MARFYPKLFKIFAQGHLVYLSIRDFHDSKDFDDAMHVVQDFANILNEMEARTAMARQGIRVECPFGLKSCNESVECLHCTPNPLDLTVLWDTRVDPHVNTNMARRGAMPAYSNGSIFGSY